RQVSAELPVVAHVTIDEGENALVGSSPETFASKLTEWGVDGLGCNCSVGPVAMLEAMERGRSSTQLPLAAQPNAGMPRSVEGRNSHLCAPEEMSSQTRNFVIAGVSVIGGCCGPTRDHIRAMKVALRVGGAKESSFQVAPVPRQQHEVEPPALAERSRLGA